MTDKSGDLEDDDSYLAIQIRFRKHPEEPDALDPSVELRRYPTSSDEPSPPPARLKGFLAQSGYLLDEDDDWYFAVFAMRSVHVVQALEILTSNRTLSKKALNPPTSLDERGGHGASPSDVSRPFVAFNLPHIRQPSRGLPLVKFRAHQVRIVLRRTKDSTFLASLCRDGRCARLELCALQGLAWLSHLVLGGMQGFAFLL